VLVLSADIGAGHDLPARLLAQAIAERAPGAHVRIADGLRAMGPFLHAVGRSGSETILQRATWLFDLQYWLLSRFAPTRWLAGTLLTAIGARGLLRLIDAEAPDAIVSTYPGTTDILGRLRRAGRLHVPCAAAVTDLAGLDYWAHPGMDVHLLIHAESRAEVLAVAGAGADVRHVRGLSRPAFDHPPSRAQARAALGLPLDGPVVLVSGGGWGVGDIERATRVALGVPGVAVVALCGTNAKLRARLERLLRDEPRGRAEGFTERMPEWLAAADVLVHSTAGLTVLEAELCGARVISYGWGVGHIRVNNRAYAEHGLATVARTPAELERALRAALADPRPRDGRHAALPAAADVVLELAGARP
jgi:UDP-N-acetylglucosamine:LPS N-acetylglucosamine transferase